MAITTLKSTRDFVRIWFYWKNQAFFIFILIVVSICFYSFTQTPVYETSAKILLLPKTNDGLVVSAGKGQRQYDIQSVDQAEINTEIELIRSTDVLNQTLAAFGQAKLEEEGKVSNKPNSLFTSMEVEPVFSSNMISVSLQSSNQYQVADVLNKLLKIYIKYHKKIYSVDESEEFYDDQKKYYGRRLKTAREKLREYNKNNSIANMDGQIQANIGLVTSFNEQLQNLEVAIAENTERMKLLKKGLRARGDKILLSKEMRSMPVIVELAKGLVPLLIKRTEISKTFTKKSREYQQINDQIAMLREEIKKEGLNAERTDNMENLALKAKQGALKRRIQYLKDKIKAFQQKKQELNALELDLQIAKKNYLLYGSKTEDSRLYAKRDKSNLSNVVIAEPAAIPASPKSPNKLLALEVSIFLGLFAAFILPFLLETIDHKLKTADDIENILSLPVVCTYNEIKL